VSRYLYAKFLTSRFAERVRSESGQGLSEYMVLIILVSLVCIPVFTWLPEAVRGYVRPFYYCLSKPFP